MVNGGEVEQRRKKRKIFGEEKNIFWEEKETKENIWRRKKIFCGGEEGKGGKYH